MISVNKKQMTYTIQTYTWSKTKKNKIRKAQKLKNTNFLNKIKKKTWKFKNTKNIFLIK